MAAEGAAAAALAAGAGAFGYNRENYLYDAEFRWERFTASREYANQQADQYREDIRNLAALTVKKNTLWCVTSTLCMALCVALYCAGRLGLHGPSPPAWIMGLWLTNNAAAFAYMALCIFLAIHASFRAQAASTQLLTRHTRVPVPTLKQLDSARKFASEFEQQDWGDIFRIPYLTNTGAPKTDDAIYDSGSKDAPCGSSARSRSAPPGRRAKCSSWAREEFEVDRAGQAPDAEVARDAAPEHFRLFAAVQKEFYQYDIYARVCIFYGFIHYVQALCYYGLGHINIELRAFWVSYGCVFVIAMLMTLLLRFDIVPSNPDKKQYLPRCEYLGPLAVLPAAIGMSLDFKVEFDMVSVAVCWLMIFVAYILQLTYALRLLEIVLPDETFVGAAERLGASYLPEGWRKVPSSFYHVFYFVAPPGKLQPGQYDLVREIKNGGKGAYDEVVGEDSAQQRRAAASVEGAEEVEPVFSKSQHVEPWKIVTSLAAVLPVCWVFLIFGCIVDAAIGEQALLTAPHWSRPPMTRLSKEPHELGTPIGFPWPAGARAWLPEQMAWHEEKRHAHTYTLGGRRLTEAQVPWEGTKAGALSIAVKSLLASMPDPDATPLAMHQVAWPAFFEPKLLICVEGGSVAALTPRGFGAMAALGSSAAVQPFRLSGLAASAPLVGASQVEDGGLLLITRAGQLLGCPGQRPQAAGAAWACRPEARTRLPVPEGARLVAAAAATIGGRLHAALVHEAEPNLVVLFAEDDEPEAWLPLGEVRLPGGHARPTVSFSGGSDLFVATGEGHVLRRRLSDGATVLSARHTVREAGTLWQAACPLQHPELGTSLAHLRLRQAAISQHAWQPELLLAESDAEKAAVFE